jgi:CRP-like cAMP-binding protein
VGALSRTRGLVIERDALLAAMRTDPKIGMAVMEDVASIAASRLRSLELDMIGLIQANHHPVPVLR